MILALSLSLLSTPHGLRNSHFVLYLDVNIFKFNATLFYICVNSIFVFAFACKDRKWMFGACVECVDSIKGLNSTENASRALMPLSMLNSAQLYTRNWPNRKRFSFDFIMDQQYHNSRRTPTNLNDFLSVCNVWFSFVFGQLLEWTDNRSVFAS